jgi:ribosomal protein L32
VFKRASVRNFRSFMTSNHNVFTCPHCGFKDRVFHRVCPECGRPFLRDYIDTQVHPRDPNPQGVYKGKFWALIFLIVILIGLVLGLLMSFHLI